MKAWRVPVLPARKRDAAIMPGTGFVDQQRHRFRRYPAPGPYPSQGYNELSSLGLAPAITSNFIYLIRNN